MKNGLLAATLAAALLIAPVGVHAYVSGVESTSGTGTQGTNDCQVSIVSYAGVRPSALIPKTITMTHVKEADYTVAAYATTANVDNLDSGISITPASSFTLTRNSDGAEATATVTQTKTTFSASDVKNGVDATLNSTGGGTTQVKKAEATGHIAADISSGSYSGTLVFTIANAD